MANQKYATGIIVKIIWTISGQYGPDKDASGDKHITLYYKL